MARFYRFSVFCLLLLLSRGLTAQAQAQVTCPTIKIDLSPTTATIKEGGAVQLQATTHAAGNALAFDGIDDYVSVPGGGGVADVPALSTVVNTFTVEAWVWPTTIHEIDAQRADGTDGTDGQRYLIFPNHNSGPWGGNHAGAGISVGTNGVSVYEHDGNYMPALLVWQGNLTSWTHIASSLPRWYPKFICKRLVTFVQRGLHSWGWSSSRRTSIQALDYRSMGLAYCNP